MRVGFIGLGAMGRAMATRLLQVGHQLRVWNRSTGPAEDFARLGAHKVERPEEAFTADATITMLADDDAIRLVLLSSGALERMPNTMVHLVMSTISIAFARELGREPINLPAHGLPESAMPR